MILVSLFLSVIASIVGAVVTYVQGGSWIEVSVAYVLSGMSAFILPALFAAFTGRSMMSRAAMEEEMLALRETMEREQKKGQGQVPDVILRGERLQAQLRTGLPRSRFGG